MKFSAFAEAIQKCNNVLRSYDIYLTDILTCQNKNTFDNVINLILGLVGLQVREIKNFGLNFVYACKNRL
jgi:hypothetical protein